MSLNDPKRSFDVVRRCRLCHIVAACLRLQGIALPRLPSRLAKHSGYVSGLFGAISCPAGALFSPERLACRLGWSAAAITDSRNRATRECGADDR